MTMTTSHTTPAVDPTATVNEILVKYPATVSVFNQFGIDACCGGAASLDEAARRDGADVDRLIRALDAIIQLSVRT
jgi:iron-sulfur cluster repair protein YtfE (RIC family)